VWAADDAPAAVESSSPFSKLGKIGSALKEKQAAAVEAAVDGPKEVETPGRFVRIIENELGIPTKLQTSVARYESKDDKDTVVDLIGAVHIGDQAYYKQLNKIFKQYDVVLYEVVTEEGKVPKPGQDSGNPVSLMQRAMQQFLELDYQLDHIDYTKKNFVHADMTPQEFAKAMAKRGENIWSVMLKMMMSGMKQQGNQPTDADILMAMFDKDRALKLKRLLARQLGDINSTTDAFGGEDGSTIITDRNTKALSVLKERLTGGQKKIAIFYGAAHMPDFEHRLIKDFHLVPTSLRWVTAWDMR